MQETSDIQGVEQAHYAPSIHAYRQQLLTVLLGAAFFILHFAEMCIVMCVSLSIFTRLAVSAGSLVGYSNAIRQLPVLSVGLLSIWFTLIMIGWMRLRRHAWRLTLEMASTSLIAAIPLIGIALLDFVPPMGLAGSLCGLACIFMVVAMLLRLDHYTGAHASHQPHVHTVQAGS